MAEIGAIITGDRRIDQIFDEFPAALHRELLERISGYTAEMAAEVRANVPRRTGRLASEVRETVRDQPERITGVVTFAAEFAKAGALEYGAHRSEQVRAHQMRLDHAFAHVLGGAELVDVPDYSRHANITAVHFLRESEQQLEARVTEGLQEVVNRVSNEA